MSYSEKLKQFNGTLKYKGEQKFLTCLIGNGKLSILDYGCGLGSSVANLNAYTNHAVHGYDVAQHNPDFAYIDMVKDKYDVIYFMHSIAHIVYLDVLLKRLKSNLNTGGRVIVITPNKDWLNANQNDHYKPDTTVMKHFMLDELIEVFEESGFQIELSGQFGKVTDNVNERLFLIAK